MNGGQVVDTPTAAEFLTQVLELTTREDLSRIAADVALKSDAMRALAGADPTSMDAAALRELLGWVFCARRKVDRIFAAVHPEELAAGIADLIHGPAGVAGVSTPSRTCSPGTRRSPPTCQASSCTSSIPLGTGCGRAGCGTPTPRPARCGW